jgi:L-threonylcarbamoyladenylate synthase
LIETGEIARAAAILREGGIVAFPTETVYGLGADALNENAVRRIFSVKGRPGTSPLIVHVAEIAMARDLASVWPAQAEELARRFWPGPLTLVLPKRSSIPDIVTSGLGTVGLRMPAHPMALALLRESGLPVAAPSANRFTELSPTTAEHVRQSLGDAVDLILDGGACTVGIESTVLSLAGQATLLRPGMISREQIEAVIGPVALAATPGEGAHASPGQHPQHYRPSTRLVLIRDGKLPAGCGAWLWIHRPAEAHTTVQMPADPERYAARLYETLHAMDAKDLEWIAVEEPPRTPEWAAVLDRLTRGAG